MGDRGRGQGMTRQDNQSFKERQRDNSTDPNLHPSWAAKRKQSGITEFSGKKIKFGDDGAVPTTAPPAVVKTPKPLAPAPAITPDSNLHPSWAAKKQKQGIQKFAGKKMVFDD